MQNINNFYKFASEDETMTNFQRKYGIHNTLAPTHNRRHRKYARLANFSLPVGGIIDDPIELEPAHTTTEGTQPYKYSAKELDRENGLDLYDSQARHYDPIIPRTTTMDPLAEKYYSLSPYTWCAANPINLIDLDGRRPTLIEAALMAKAAYGESVKLKGGWSLYYSRESKSGLKYAVFSRSINDKTEYTVATAGTDLTSIKDWENNITQLFGKSKQYAESVDLANIFIENHEGEEVTFVGHSLGGGLAAANALYTNCEAITFNSAYLSKSTISAFNLDLSRGKRITNYTVNGEILADVQSSMVNLVRIGKQINLNYSNSVGEQILSKCLNVILPSTFVGTEMIDKVKRHSIDAVIRSIKQ